MSLRAKIAGRASAHFARRVDRPSRVFGEDRCCDWPLMRMFTARSSADCAGACRKSTLLRAHDALPEGTPDPAVLAWAAAENRVVITNDRNTMVGFAYQRVMAGERMCGLIVTTNEQSIGSAIEDILLVAAECVPEEEIRSRVIVFLPIQR